MAEYIPPQEGHGRAGHLPDAAGTLVELHRLMATFLASRAFADLVDAEVNHAAELNDPIVVLQEVEEAEITRILLTLAVTARVLDDANEHALELVAGTCGTLAPDLQQEGVRVDLELREACNKIIHSTTRHFDMERNQRGRLYLQPTLYLYGRQGRNEWKAVLDVIAFAKEYTSCVTRL